HTVIDTVRSTSTISSFDNTTIRSFTSPTQVGTTPYFYPFARTPSQVLTQTSLPDGIDVYAQNRATTYDISVTTAGDAGFYFVHPMTVVDTVSQLSGALQITS